MKMSSIRLRVRLDGKKKIFQSRFTRDQCHLPLHLCRVALEKSYPVAIDVKNGMVELPSEGRTVGGTGVLHPVQSCVIGYQVQIAGRLIGIDAQSLLKLRDRLIVLPNQIVIKC